MNKGQAALVVLALLASIMGCGKNKQPKQRVAEPAAVRSDTLPTGLASAASETGLAGSATATGLAAEATQSGQPASGSVALAIDSGQGGASGLPTTQGVTTITVTPLNAKGQPATARGRVLDAELVLVAARYDMSWLQVQRAETLSDAARNSHVFRVQFTQAGSHKLYVVWQPATAGGKEAVPPAVTTVTLQVQGEAAPGQAWNADERHFKGADGSEAEVSWDGGTLQPCKPTRVTTLWKEGRGKVAAKGATPADSAPRLLYLAVSQAGGDAVAALPQDATSPAAAASTSALGGDAGADAWLTFSQTGVHRVLALRHRRGRTITAHFGVRVEGQLPAGGCPQP